MSDFITSATTAVTGSFSAFLSGVASAVVDTFDAIFVTSEGGLTNLAAWGLMFLAIGFGSRFLRKFTNKAG